MKHPLCLVILASLFVTVQIPTYAALQGPFSAQLIGQLHPVGLPDGIQFGGGGHYGHRVDISGNLSAVGAGIFLRGEDKGHAFVFDHSDPNNIRQIAHIRASDNAAGNEFGGNVAISGDYVFVTARGDRQNRGAVYMYDVSDPNNITERKITAFDEAPYNSFGFSLSVEGTRMAVGAPRVSAASTLDASVYIIDFSNPDNILQTKVSQDPSAGFGNSVAISGNYLLAGRSSDGTDFNWAGSAQLYDISNLNNIRSQRLTPTDAPNYRSFGERVAIHGNTAVINVASDPGPTNDAGNTEGAIWAFDLSDWDNIKQSEYGRSTFNPGYYRKGFGQHLAIEDDLVIASGSDASNGAIYLNDVSDALNPKELLKITALPNTSGFGGSFQLDGQTLLVSDQADNVFLYNIVPEPATAASLFMLFTAITRSRPRNG